MTVIKASVLVVDDDPGMCAMLSSRLTTRGFRVVTASTGNDAIEIVQRDDVEVVVSDVNMKGMNGVELCQRLLEHRPQLPVVLITAFGSMELAIQAIRAGAYDFVIASRARGAREPGSMAWHQLLAGRIAGVLTRLLYGVRYTDMCAFRAIRCDTLLALGMRELTYGWNLEMQMRAARAGLRVLEVPVVYRRRLGGQSKVAGSLRGSVKAGVKIISTFARVAMEPARGRAS